MAPCGQMVGGGFYETPPIIVGAQMPVPTMDRFGAGGPTSGGYGGGYGGGGYGCGGSYGGFHQQGGGMQVMHYRRVTTRTFSYPCGHPSCAPGRTSVTRR